MSAWAQGSFLLYGLKFFTKSSFEKSAKSKKWEDLHQKDLKGFSIIVTGANAGLGYSSSMYFAERGATLHMLCRSPERGGKAQDAIKEASGNDNVHLHICDLSKQTDIHNFVKKFIADGHSVDVLVNNAGVLLQKRTETEEGIETTLAVNTVSTYLLTYLLLPVLIKSKRPRVVIVSSGGALTQGLDIRDNYEDKKWTGMASYAKTKRQQICLTERFDEMFGDLGIGFYACHPGWAATPGVISSIPEFYGKLKKKFRTQEQGADIICWLAVTDNLSSKQSGLFFRDRKKELKDFCISSTPYTKKEALDFWAWCGELTKYPGTEKLSIMADLQKRQNSAKETRKLAMKMKSTVTVKSHGGFTGNKFPNTFTGKEAIDFIVSDCGLSREMAIKRAEDLRVEGFFANIEDATKPVTDSAKDFYAFYNVPTSADIKERVSDEWVKNMVDRLDVDNISGKWTPKGKEQTEYQVYVQDEPGTALKVFKCVLPLPNVSGESVVNLLHSEMIERHAEWNKTYISGFIAKKVSDHVNVQYWAYKVAVPGVSNRDFAVARRLIIKEDGTIIIVDRSIDAIPPKKGFVRCNLSFNVRYFKPLEDSKGYTFYYMNLTDLMGSLPKSLSNAANAGVSIKEMKEVREICQEDTRYNEEEDESLVDMLSSESTEEAAPRKKKSSPKEDEEPKEVKKEDDTKKSDTEEKDEA